MSSRAKKFVVAVSVVVLIGIICGVAFFINARSLGSSSPTNDEKTVEKTLGDFRAIDGTDYLIASVTSSASDASVLSEVFSSGRWYGGGSPYSQYNLVFLDSAAEKVYPLLATNDYQIISMEGFPTPVQNFNQTSPPQPTDPIAWWLFSIIKSDTNQDKELSLPDKQTLSISDVGGKGYTEIVSGVDDLLGTAYKNKDTLLIIYRSDGKNYLAHVNLPARQVDSTEELPLGEEIK